MKTNEHQKGCCKKKDHAENKAASFAQQVADCGHAVLPVGFMLVDLRERVQCADQQAGDKAGQQRHVQRMRGIGAVPGQEKDQCALADEDREKTRNGHAFQTDAAVAVGPGGDNVEQNTQCKPGTDQQ